MGFVAVYDANVLYPNTLRDVLIRVAQSGLVQAKWTEEILDEVFRSLKANMPDLDADALSRTRALMGRAVRDWKVKGYEPLVSAIQLPDPDDRHVLAAAIRAKAQVIVTYNLRDFPDKALAPWDIDAVHPDSFLEAQIHLDPSVVYSAVQRIADSWVNPPGTVADVLEKLDNLGLVSTVAALRAL